MVLLLRMLETQGLSLSDAESGGFQDLAEAARRCQRCLDTNACIRWLKWRGRYGRSPVCMNVSYFDRLKERAKPN